ncbi:PspC domain-containing protein [Plantactinospora sp. GCM10030261]|uniref:PspC domain-containing protein n=1 Tax=Plantactinospora sp. GCM10030261 TaxID=3273420 RepID=UPI00360CF824
MTYQTSEAPLGSAPPVRSLRRSRTDRLIGGVCGGLGRYLGIDPLLVRVTAVALVLSGGTGLLAYVIGWILIPEAGPGSEAQPPAPATPVTVTVLVGGLLLVAGAVLLLRRLLPWVELGIVWPVLLLLAGALVVVSGLRRKER